LDLFIFVSPIALMEAVILSALHLSLFKTKIE
jgi:hypothetical protein